MLLWYLLTNIVESWPLSFQVKATKKLASDWVSCGKTWRQRSSTILLSLSFIIFSYQLMNLLQPLNGHCITNTISSCFKQEDYYTASRQANDEHKKKYPDYYYSPKEARLRKRWKMQQQQLVSSGQYNPLHLVKVFMNDDGADQKSSTIQSASH